MKRIAIALLLACGSAGAVAQGVERATKLPSATIARDINGFELGMHLREVNALAPLQPIGGSQFEATRDGIHYNFEATPAGRVYRISSVQPLGRFTVDAQFLRTLRARLAGKYGAPEPSSADPFSWELVEPVSQAGGPAHPFRTMWFSVYTSSGDGGSVDLNMTMIDFRLLWIDQQAANRPRAKAEEVVRF